MSVALQAHRLAEHVRTLQGFRYLQPESPSDHVGEVLANSVLQAGVRYETVVAPRLRRIREEYPDATTVSTVRALLMAYGSKVFLSWSHPEKPKRLDRLTDTLFERCVNTLPDLRDWLRLEQNRSTIRAIPGVGPKTVDYLSGLVGLQTIAVDRHIRSFALSAGVQSADYNDIKRIVQFAADMLGVPRQVLDTSIWRYQAGKKATGTSAN